VGASTITKTLTGRKRWRRVSHSGGRLPSLTGFVDQNASHSTHKYLVFIVHTDQPYRSKHVKTIRLRLFLSVLPRVPSASQEVTGTFLSVRMNFQ